MRRVERADPGPECSLFVVWDKGRHCRERILADLQRRFEVISTHEVVWTPSKVNENFRRFYSDLQVRGVYHRISKGTGPFLAVVVVDPAPVVEERMTSRGLRTVNGRFLDAKTIYREWAGRLVVHCTETPFETDRDLIMLFGRDADGHRRAVTEPWTGRIERLERDLTGSDGWQSESELFGVLNRSVAYVVTGAAAVNSGPAVLGADGDVDLLTNDYHALHAVLNARPREAPRQGGTFRVRVAGEWVEIGVRYVGDRYYCTEWASALVESRVQDAAGFYRPPEREAFEALAYHAFLHTREPGAVVRKHLAAQASALGWTPTALASARDAKPLLDELLARRGYRYATPRDTTRFFNHRVAGSRWPALRCATRRVTVPARRVTDALRTFYWQVRDRLVANRLFRAVRPWVPRLGGTREQLSRVLRGRRLAGLKRAALLLRGLAFVGHRYRCPCCGWRVRGFAGQWGLLASNHDGYCPRCNAKARHRRLWLYLREHSDLFSRGQLRLLEVAPWWALSRRFARMPNIRFVGLDVERRGPHVTVRGDATSIPLGSESLDAALCIHTLEHIDADRRAIAELYRVLKPGGWAIVSVPIRLDRATFEDPSIREPAERAQAFGEPSHVRYYGIDLRDRLTAAGFRVHLDRADGVAPETRGRFGLRDDEHIFHCHKPNGTAGHGHQ